MKKEREGRHKREEKRDGGTSLSQACLHVCWEEASAAQPMSLSLVSQPTSGNLHYGCSCVTPNSKNTLLLLLSLSPSNVRCRRHHSVGREDSPWRCRWASGCQRSWNHWAGSVTPERGKKTNSSLAQSPRLLGFDWSDPLPPVVCVVVCVRLCVFARMEHLRVVHVPQQGISLSVQDEVAPLEAAAALLLLDVQEAAHSV